MAYSWSGMFKVIFIATALIQASTAQGTKDSYTTKINSNVTGTGHSSQQSVAVYSLNDFLAHFGMNQFEKSKQKRNIKSEAPPKLPEHSTRNHQCPCNQKLPMQRSPHCVRRFLVKQLQETNENINCLLGCLARNSIKCKCPLPPRLSLNLHGEPDTYGFETVQSQTEGGHSSANDATKGFMYPCSCGLCMYESNLPSDETPAEINRRMIGDEPLVYYRIHSTPNGDGLDWNHFNDIKRFLVDTHEEIEVEQDDHIAEVSHRRKSRKASTDSKIPTMFMSRSTSAEAQNFEF